MTKFVIWLIANALAVGAAVWLFDGISLAGADTDTDKIVSLVIVGAIFGAITGFVRPVVNLLALPLIVLTLGLMLFVTNGLMLLLTSKVADTFGLHFHVDGFWTAVFGAIVISIAGVIVNAILPETS
ncbi:putative membrane protein [Marmoricola sp. OAE513]|uniref:phage holin family protein n=1 Tax=Marmoricola sp. OAE513 TaxID=2817894 RepID=UPI001AE1C35F